MSARPHNIGIGNQPPELATGEGTFFSSASVDAMERVTDLRAPQSSLPSSKVVDTGGKPARHVLYVIDQLCRLGGAERVLLEMVRRLSPERFRCSVVAFKTDPALDALKNLPAQVHVLPLERTYDLNAAKMAFRLRRFIRQENVSIVHTFFETSDLWAGPVAKLSGCPFLISSRRDMGILRTRKHRIAYPAISRLCDRVLTVSNEVRGYCLRQDRMPPNRVETLYNGVDLAEIDAKSAEGDARKQLGLPNDVPLISTVANIRSVKGLDVLVRAAKRICSEFPNAAFVVVGSVLELQTMAALRAQVETLDLGRNFHFVGAYTNPFPVLRASTIFCLPSRNEGFSNALVEAMGCGLACVATCVGGNAEAVTDGKNGFLVASEDADGMADRILQLLRDPSLAQRVGRHARETVKSRFSMEAMMSRLMNIYDELLVAKNV
jgi:L-malate glycosyltransferase